MISKYLYMHLQKYRFKNFLFDIINPMPSVLSCSPNISYVSLYSFIASCMSNRVFMLFLRNSNISPITQPWEVNLCSNCFWKITCFWTYTMYKYIVYRHTRYHLTTTTNHTTNPIFPTQKCYQNERTPEQHPSLRWGTTMNLRPQTQ